MSKLYAGFDFGEVDNDVVIMENIGTGEKIYAVSEEERKRIAAEILEPSKDVNISLPVMSMKINTK